MTSDAEILMRNGYCPIHKVKLAWECFNHLGDGREVCLKCEAEEKERLKQILAAGGASSQETGK